MTTLATLVGPPGTGKTTASLALVREWFLRHGGRPDNVAYLTFTKDAAEEARGRLYQEGVIQDPSTPMPYFKTIHALAYAGLARERGGKVNVVNTSEMKEFMKETGLNGTYATYGWEDLHQVYQQMKDSGRSEWDAALSAYRLSRISVRKFSDLGRAALEPSRLANETVPVAIETYRSFVTLYERFKAKRGLVDFEDMLYYALEKMRPLENVKYVIVDEAQDISPVLNLIVDRIFPSAELLVFAGDADQAIFQFAAADANLFIERYHKSDWRIHLTQTNRFGQEIVDFSQRIIKRVRNRIDSPVTGVQGRSHAIERTGQFKPTVADMMILHRHVKGCQEVASAYIAAGLPFRNERGKDPLGSGARIQGFHALRDLSEGKQISWIGVSRLIGDLMPSTYVSSDGAEKQRLVVHGGKAALQEDQPGMVDLNELVERKILTEDGARVVRMKEIYKLKHADDLSYYDRVIDNGYNLASEKMPVITTMHGSKGREAPHVVIFSEMGKKCWKDPDTEHRLAYVASSRTQGTIEICQERKLDWADHPYDYPVDGGGHAV